MFFVFAAAVWPRQPAEAVWRGVLHNAAGAPVSGAKIRLTAKSAKAEAVTSPDGRFQLPGLPAGQYQLTVDANHSRIEYQQLINLVIAAPAVSITLSERGELAVGGLDGKSGTGGEELSSKEVSELPLNKRDFSTLLLLAAGTMTDANGATNFTAAVRHQRAARCGGDICHGWRGHQRSGDGRRNIHQLQCGCS